MGFPIDSEVGDTRAMATANDRVVTVFGGSGFVGRRIVRHLRLHGFHVRVASRHADHVHALRRPDDPQLQSIKADVHDARSVADALADAYGVVNAVSLFVEQGRETFHSVHVEAAQRVAAQAQRAGVKRLVHVSGIGADPRSPSLYIRKRAEGELAVRKAFPDVLIRPAVMFGPDDAFLTRILKLLERFPVYPMFGDGQVRLQPVHVEDVGQAIAKILQREQAGRLYSSALARASTRTRNYLEPSRTRPASSPYCFQFHSRLGAHWRGWLKFRRARQSREIRWN